MQKFLEIDSTFENQGFCDFSRARIMDYSKGLNEVFMRLGCLFTCQSVQNDEKCRVGIMEHVGNLS